MLLHLYGQGADDLLDHLAARLALGDSVPECYESGHNTLAFCVFDSTSSYVNWPAEWKFSAESFVSSIFLLIFAAVTGDKIPCRDALAYYFALTEKTSEICFGIVRSKKAKGKASGWHFLTSCIKLCTRHNGVVLSYMK